MLPENELILPTFHLKSASLMINQGVGEAPLFKNRRYLRGIRNKGGSSGMEYPAPAPPMNSATSTSYRTAANDSGPTPIDALLNPQGMLDENARRSSRPWSFTHALWLGLIISALFWGAIAAVIHYF